MPSLKHVGRFMTPKIEFKPRNIFFRSYSELIQEAQDIQLYHGGGGAMLLNIDGKGYTVGQNDFGQCGVAKMTKVLMDFQPVRYGEGKIENVVMGVDTTWVFCEKNELWCHGKNDSGQLGLRGEEFRRNVYQPVKIDFMSERFVNSIEVLAPGVSHTILIGRDKDCKQKFYATGGNNFFQYSQCNQSNRYFTDFTNEIKLPSEIKDIKVGLFHTFALLKNGTVWCRGRGYEGQIGSAFESPEFIELELPVEKDETIVKIYSGQFYGLAYSSLGNIYQWGNGLDGFHVRNADEGNLKMTLSKPRKLPLIPNIQDISVGPFHFFIQNKDNRIFAMGLGTDGQLLNHQQKSMNELTEITNYIEDDIDRIIAGDGFSVLVCK